MKDDAAIAKRLRRAIETGELSYLSIAKNTRGNWECTFASVDNPGHRQAEHKDPMECVNLALGSQPKRTFKRNDDDVL